MLFPILPILRGRIGSGFGMFSAVCDRLKQEETTAESYKWWIEGEFIYTTMPLTTGQVLCKVWRATTGNVGQWAVFWTSVPLGVSQGRLKCSLCKRQVGDVVEHRL